VILVYLVKSYCVLKMSENKKEIIFDTFQNFITKKKNATQAAKKVCDVYEHDAVSVHVAQSVFNLKIFISKMHFALIDQSLQKLMKSWKKLSKTGTLAVMISVRN